MKKLSIAFNPNRPGLYTEARCQDVNSQGYGGPLIQVTRLKYIGNLKELLFVFYVEDIFNDSFDLMQLFWQNAFLKSLFNVCIP